MLLLDNDDVKQVLEVGACLEALEQAYRAQAAGRALTWEDAHRRREVVLISENLAREFFKTPAAAIGNMSLVLVWTTTPVMPKSTNDLASPNSFLTLTCSASAVGGIVFGMSTTVVMPPQTAAVEPVLKSSL